MVSLDKGVEMTSRNALTFVVGLRVLQGIQALHQRGYHQVRAFVGLSASGMHWRATIAEAALHPDGLLENASVIRYATGSYPVFQGYPVSATTSAAEFANLMEVELALTRKQPDHAYVDWFVGLVDLVMANHRLPIAYSDDHSGPGVRVDRFVPGSS